MKVRSTLSPADEIELRAEIDRRLSGLGIETQPAVAAGILALVGDPEAGLRQYTDLIRNDVSLTGRLLRLANSAYFAQVRPVTTLERAGVLLGLERLKAVSLGFYLSRAAATDRNHVLSRRVWAQSVLRACLGAELARLACPAHVAEAFTIGLMLDAGVPLLHRIFDKPVERILASGEPPGAQFRIEFEALPFTHVDVIAALVRRWSLPELLARPIERHHAPPDDADPHEPVSVLHRIAYYTGAVVLAPAPEARVAEPMEGVAQGLLAIRPEHLAAATRRAADEYAAIHDAFRGVADTMDDLSGLAERVHTQLLAVLDRSLADALREEAGPVLFTIAGHRVEIETQRDGRAVAYLRDERGERLISHGFQVGRIDAAPLLDALGLDPVTPEHTRELDLHLRSLAA